MIIQGQMYSYQDCSETFYVAIKVIQGVQYFDSYQIN